MSNSYTLWLGIEPHELPPDHYRLLDLPPFEDSCDVIQAAAARQSDRVLTQADYPHDHQARELLAQIAAACDCLCHPQRKARYDFDLWEHWSTAEFRPRFPPASSHATATRQASASHVEFNDTAFLHDAEQSAEAEGLVDLELIEDAHAPSAPVVRHSSDSWATLSHDPSVPFYAHTLRRTTRRKRTAPEQIRFGFAFTLAFLILWGALYFYAHIAGILGALRS